MRIRSWFPAISWQGEGGGLQSNLDDKIAHVPGEHLKHNQETILSLGLLFNMSRKSTNSSYLRYLDTKISHSPVLQLGSASHHTLQAKISLILITTGVNLPPPDSP